MLGNASLHSEQNMRELYQSELLAVAGGEFGGGPIVLPPIGDDDTRSKNNNGYGNGPESGPPPGNSGDHNPQLTTWNSGPRGPR